MTDEPTDPPTEEPAAEEPAADATPAVATAAIEPAAHEQVSFWHRPNVERYLLPLITPIVVALAVVIFVLNISRVFLAAHGEHVPLVIGTIITVAILVGASVFSNASSLRSHSLILMTAGFCMVAISAGWLLLGSSQVKTGGGAPLAATGPCKGTINITALPSIKFTPVSVTATTGIYCITLTDAASVPHTLDFDDAATLFPGLEVQAAGEKSEGRIFFGQAGAYTYFCAIPGHRAAGMQGVVNVTGPTVTRQQAEAEGGTGGSGASGSSGASGASGSSGASGASGATGAS